MNRILNLLMVLCLVVLTACSTTPSVVVQQRLPVAAPQVQPVNMKPVEWKVLTQAELEAILEDLKNNPNPNFVLFALTPNGFENLNYNLIEIKRFMQEQQEVVIYYKGLVSPTPATENE